MDEHEPEHEEVTSATWHTRGKSSDYMLVQLGSRGPCQILALSVHGSSSGDVVLDTDNWGVACGAFVRLCVEAQHDRLRMANLPAFLAEAVTA